MKLADALLLSLGAVFVIIGIYEVIAVGLSNAYWAIMLAVLVLFIYSFRKKR